MADSTANAGSEDLWDDTPEKENSKTSSGRRFAWRKNEETPLKSVSKGISPTAFHKGENNASSTRRRRKAGQDVVDKLHSNIQDTLVKEGRKKVLQELELRRSAFRQVTTMRTWPLQERALMHRQQLLEVHLHTSNSAPESQGGDAVTSSSSSSAVSAGEPKRALRDLLLSPAKSQLKVQLQQQFLKEQALSNPSDSSEFGSALWCMEPRVFSSEKEQGKRKYTCGHLGRFLDHYWRKTDPLRRHYYELIPQHTPCRLYLDLEFSKLTNVIDETDSELLLDELFEELAVELANKFPDLAPLERSHVVDLDSSTDSKFSRHWVVHTSALFANNVALGAFVRNWIGRLVEERATGQLSRRMINQYLLVDPAPSKSKAKLPERQQCLVDLGVYTRNRLFRLLGSAKFSKPPSAALRIAEANQFPLKLRNEQFYAPAATNENAPFVDNVDEQVAKFRRSTDWTLHAEALAQTLVVPMNVTKIDYPILPYDEESNGTSDVSKPSTFCAPRFGPQPPSLSVGPTPYPSIDGFVANVLATKGGIQGSIRGWTVDRDEKGIPNRINYQMSRNRWCECIGRPHKSNNVVWTVDLQLWHCIQSCHDPECRALQFRGTPVPLPAPVRDEVSDALFEEALANADECELLRLPKQFQKATVNNIEAAFDDDDAFERALAALNIDGL